MRIKHAKNLFMCSSLRNFAGFYQEFTRNIVDPHEVCNRLICQADAAQAFRQSETVWEIGQILSNFPIKEAQVIGRYYIAWCAFRKGEQVQNIFEEVVEQSELYRARALWSLGAIEASKGNLTLEYKLFSESLKYASDISTVTGILRGIAVVKAKEGFHKSALKDLENLLPIIRYAEPHVYYEFLNSYAVELGEVGQIEQANKISNIALASPFAKMYPEFYETSVELRTRRGHRASNIVTVGKSVKEDNVLAYQPRADERVPSHVSAPAKVLSFEEWKRIEMAKGQRKEKEQEEQSLADKEREILHRVGDTMLTHEQADQILEILREAAKKNAQQP